LSNNGFNYEDIKKIAGQTAADEMQKYATAISEALGDITKNSVDAAISSITNGKVENIQVNQANEDILRKLGAQFDNEQNPTTAILDWSNTDINNYQERVATILSLGLNPEEIDAWLEALEKAVYKNDVSDAFDAVIGSYDGFSEATAQKLARALGITIDKLNLSFDNITGEYSIGL